MRKMQALTGKLLFIGILPIILLSTMFIPYSMAVITTCNGIPSVYPDVCSGRGECVGYNQCECFPGFTGDNCELAVTYTCFGIPFDDPKVCSGRGVCVGYDQCECYPGFTSNNCEW